MKVFWEITSISDCHKLHEDVKGILLWCDENHVVLNRSTTTLDTCSCKTSVMFFSYKLSSRHLSHVSNILVLAMFFSYSKPLFHIRIEMISSHAMQTSWMISRIPREVNRTDCFITLFKCFCLPRLEYVSVVWNGTTMSDNSGLDRVVKKFHCLLSRRQMSGQFYSFLRTDGRFYLGMEVKRRMHADLIFFQLFTRYYWLSYKLLEIISLRTPQ